MLESDLKAYLKAAAPSLPCAEARAAFSSYVRGVVCDVCGDDLDADFSTAAMQLGTSPRQAARDFVENQSPQTQARWQTAARRRRLRLWVAVGLVIAILAGIVAFFIVTKGVMVVTTETTVINWGDTDMTLEEQTRAALELTRPKE